MRRPRTIVERFNCYVVDRISHDKFEAIFVDQEDTEYTADMRYDEFPAHDRKHLISGMRFWWWIWHYDDDPDTGHSTFKIRKSFWKQEDIDRGLVWAKELKATLETISAPDDHIKKAEALAKTLTNMSDDTVN